MLKGVILHSTDILPPLVVTAVTSVVRNHCPVDISYFLLRDMLFLQIVFPAIISVQHS